MSEYTSLEVSKRLAEAGFKAEDRHLAAMVEDGRGGATNVWAYRADTLLAWLLSHGDSIEITPDLDGFNCTFWKGHEDYNGINIFLCDALAELVIKVLEVNTGAVSLPPLTAEQESLEAES